MQGHVDRTDGDRSLKASWNCKYSHTYRARGVKRRREVAEKRLSGPVDGLLCLIL
jgi:hypothetical protein